jgi:flagellar P-ring protein FlgI
MCPPKQVKFVMKLLCTLLMAALMATLSPMAHADRVKDLVTVAAMRPNQLIGYGLVVGLEGSGDGTDVSFTVQSMRAMLNRLGVSLEGALTDFEQTTRGGRTNIQNVAAVMVTAELPGLSKPGQKIDINVSAIGKAKSLRGGNLLLTSLRGIDGQVYALAQGPLTATGVEASAAGSKVSIGVPTSGRIPGGAIVERTIDTPFDKSDHVVLNLREPDFTTATSIVKSVNEKYGTDIARAIDPVSIAIRAPEDISQRVAFISMVENMDVIPGEPPARVVVNARTGTVVISRHVKVSASAVSHGTISVKVTATNEVSQPNMLAQGQTTVVQNADIAVSDPKAPMFLFQPGVDLRQIVDAVNQVGATPSALIAILEALKNSGGLRAELIII